jgi:hypothetical protein
MLGGKGVGGRSIHGGLRPLVALNDLLVDMFGDMFELIAGKRNER